MTLTSWFGVKPWDLPEGTALQVLEFKRCHIDSHALKMPNPLEKLFPSQTQHIYEGLEDLAEGEHAFFGGVGMGCWSDVVNAIRHSGLATFLTDDGPSSVTKGVVPPSARLAFSFLFVSPRLPKDEFDLALKAVVRKLAESSEAHLGHNGGGTGDIWTSRWATDAEINDVDEMVRRGLEAPLLKKRGDRHALSVSEH